MDSFDDDSSEPSSSDSTRGDPKVEAVHELLEEGWFFGKLLVDSKPRILRCYSDPSPNFDQKLSARTSPREKSSSTRKLVSTPGILTHAPSLPPIVGREEKIHETESNTSTGTTGVSRKFSIQLSDHIQKPSCVKMKEESSQERVSHANTSRSKIVGGQSSHHSLPRIPSLPHYLGREGMIEENESDEITISKLIRQAMPLSSDIMPRQRSSKMIMRKYRPPRNSELESSDALQNSYDPTRHNRYPKNQTKLEKSLSNLEFHEMQWLKGLGFTFDRQDLKPPTPSMVQIFAGLQEKKKCIKQDQDKVRGPFPSTSWQIKSCACAPPIPLAAKDPAQNIKAQLKFWARAVASNVR